MKKTKTIFHVDAFTSEPFKGNPAAVCILEKEPESGWMQNIAMEMNLSETAFVFPGIDCRIIRFYTPEAEIPLCGHATLSASHILYETGRVKQDKSFSFSSKAGELLIMKDGDWIKMNFPAYYLTKMEISDDFESLTGIRPQELYKTGHGWTFALLKNEEEVKNISPHFAKMKDTVFGDLIVTAPSSDNNFDFCVRCFAPALGINEDPVTGSAHCALVPFWSEKTGKKDLMSHQISKREGILKVSLISERVEISGQALTVSKSELYI